MIILMKKSATPEQIDHVTGWIASVGYKPHLSQGVERTLIGAIGDERGKVHLKSAVSLPGVEKVVPILKPYKLAGWEFQENDTVVRFGDVSIGGGEFTFIAGPCSVESEEQMMECGYIAKKTRAKILRSGLPGRLHAGMDPEQIRLRLGLDKKKEGGKTHYVLLKKIGMPFLNGGVPEGILLETLEEMKR